LTKGRLSSLALSLAHPALFIIIVPNHCFDLLRVSELALWFAACVISFSGADAFISALSFQIHIYHSMLLLFCFAAKIGSW